MAARSDKQPMETIHQPGLSRRLTGGLVMAVIGGVVGAAVGAGAYYAIGAAMVDQVLPLLLVGPMTGLGVRLIGRRSRADAGWVAVICTVIACVVGFVLLDFRTFVPPMLSEAMRRLISLVPLLAIALSCMFGYPIAIAQRARRAGPPPRCLGCSADLRESIAAGHRHCPHCGAPIPPEALGRRR